jgi:hypothetical protein
MQPWLESVVTTNLRLRTHSKLSSRISRYERLEFTVHPWRRRRGGDAWPSVARPLPRDALDRIPQLDVASTGLAVRSKR